MNTGGDDIRDGGDSANKSDASYDSRCYSKVHLVQVIVLFDGLSADRRSDSRHPGAAPRHDQVLRHDHLITTSRLTTSTRHRSRDQ